MASDTATNAYGLPIKHEFKLPEIVLAASAGTVIDWYDFYIFGSLSFVISPLFFPNAAGDPVLSLLVTLLTFWIGFAVRPFGAIVFGRIGDLIGRKYTFLVTLVIMGGATTHHRPHPDIRRRIGIAAPLILSCCASSRAWRSAASTAAPRSTSQSTRRMESAATTRAWIQTTATIGLFVSLARRTGHPV